jgi:hypothetical protein
VTPAPPHDEDFDERIAPLLHSIGRTVFTAALLEKLLLADIAQRAAGATGITRELGAEIAKLERRSAGVLVGRLRELGIAPEVAERLEKVLRQRNDIVHHLLEDPAAVVAIATGTGLQGIVDRIDAVAVECQHVIEQLGPDASAGMNAVLMATVGTSLADLVERAQTLDPGAIGDDELRAVVKYARTLDPDELRRMTTRPHDS